MLAYLLIAYFVFSLLFTVPYIVRYMRLRHHDGLDVDSAPDPLFAQAEK